MNQLALQIVIIILISIIITFIRRVLHRWWPRDARYYTFWPIILGYYSLANLTWLWFPYVMIGWALVGILLVIVQIAFSGELFYRRFWRSFWQFSVLYSIIVYIGSIIFILMG